MPAWAEITALEIMEAIRGTRLAGDVRTVIRGISTDSRSLRPGELFWALKGERFDGHGFISSALEKGAAGVVIREDHGNPFSSAKAHAGSSVSSGTAPLRSPVIIAVPDTLAALGDLAAWWRRRQGPRVVAVTGSSGKTTTKEMTACILERTGRTLKTRGNFNNLIGLPLTLLRLEGGHETAVVEMGMNRPGEIARLTEIADPDVGVITNVGLAHLEGLGDIRGVARAKTELVERISTRGKVVLNGDDELLLQTAAPFQREMLTFGTGEKNDVRPAGVRHTKDAAISFELLYPEGAQQVRLAVPGTHNLMNALAAAAAALCLGVSSGDIAAGLSLFRGLEGRFRRVSLPGRLTLVDDTYNANPSSLKAALSSVAVLGAGEGRILVGIGEMMELGRHAAELHRAAGRWVAGIRPRFFAAMGAHADEMVAGAVEGGLSPDRARVTRTHGEMTDVLRGAAEAGDVILIKGSRKMAMERVVEGFMRQAENPS